MRENLIEEMLKEVYGPRNGAEEEISGDPVKEYITGVIIPQRCRKVEEDPDSEITVSMGENFLADDDILTEEVLVSTPSELDPKMRPRSFGISFVVEGESPSFRICVTWGRYVIDQEKGIWRRMPYCVLKRISMDEETMKKLTLYEGSDGKVLLHVRKVGQDGECNVIIVSMVNDLKIQKCYGESLTGASVFQPSIRIKMDNDTQLAPLPRKGGELLHFLYRKKKAFLHVDTCAQQYGKK